MKTRTTCLLLLALAYGGRAARAQTPFVANAADYPSLQDALDSPFSKIVIPANATYTINKPLLIRSGKTLEAVDRATSAIVYNGGGCAIQLDGTKASALRNLNLQVQNKDANGICLTNVGGDSQWNVIEHNLVVQASGARSGVGLSLSATTSNALYWNAITNNDFGVWATAIQLVGVAAPNGNGPNQNRLSGNMIWASTIGLDLSTSASDNVVAGLLCSCSLPSGFGTSCSDDAETCVRVGDGANTTWKSQYNQLTGVVSDQGPASRAFYIQANAQGTLIQVDKESGAPNVNQGTLSTIFDLVGGVVTLGRVIVSGGIGTDGSGLKHGRGSSCTAAPGRPCSSWAVSWNTPFADLNYTLTCSIETNTSGLPVLSSAQKGLGGAWVTIVALTDANAAGTINCIAIHD
jgi:hypothetical protein